MTAMNKKTFLVKLIPLGRFYFGGETGFANDARGEGRSSYIVRSRLMPQQTTLCGALRYWIWQTLGTDLKDAPIGDESFNLNDLNTTQSFGALMSISELYIWHNEELWLPANLDRGYSSDKHTEQFVLNGYDPKDYRSAEVVNSKGMHKTIESGIFEPAEQIGVLTHASKKRHKYGDEEGLYKQTFYKSRNIQDGFACFVELDTNSVKPSESLFIHMGGESNLFKVTLSETSKPDNTAFYKHYKDKTRRVILSSDALLSNKDLANTSFAYANAADVRFMQTDRRYVKHWSNLKKATPNSNSPSLSGKYEFFEKGSVFYFDDANKQKAFTARLEEAKRLRQIGYNQYVSIE